MSCSGCSDSFKAEDRDILVTVADTCSGLLMSIVSGVFLIASLIVVVLLKINLRVDPAWVTVAVSGFPLLHAAVSRLIMGKGMAKITSALLISIAMIAAIGIGELFAAGQVAIIMAIGGILEEKTIERARRGLKDLVSLVPELGRLIDGQRTEMVSVENIRENDILRVLPGEAVPVDGEIVAGDTSVDQSVITGESLPVDKSVGDDVYCGTINRFGAIDIRATSVGEDSSIKKLIRLVEQAEENQAPLERIADKWAGWLVPLALFIAVITFLITGNIIRAVTIAIVFCPCALALSTPTSIMAAIGQAAKNGVIIKSGEALEFMGKVDTIAFDKTGTLTHGSIRMSDLMVFDKDMGEDEFLSFVASIEARSEHPLGKAIVEHARERKVPLREIDGFVMTPGKGVRAVVDSNEFLCGNEAFLRGENIVLDPDFISALKSLQNEGKSVVAVSRAAKGIGVIALSDTLRSSAKSMVEELRLQGVGTALLTGDNRQTAEYFARQAGIETVCAELLPAGKVLQIEELKNSGRTVCMIGDGVNDAPALKTADVGVAMGVMGSDIAVDAAGIALMSDDIAKIPYLKRLSAATVKLIAFNITVSILFNAIAITLSIFGVLNPITGALAHNAGSVMVVLNAALMYDRKFL